MGSKTHLLLTATQLPAIKTHHFSNHDPNLDVFEALRASKAIPGAYGKRVNIQGTDYIDGDISTSLADNIRTATSLGCKNVIAISTSNSMISADHIGIAIQCLQDPQARAAIVKRIGKKLQKPQPPAKGSNVMTLRPKQKLPTRTLNNTPEAVAKSHKQGVFDTMDSRELNDFFDRKAKAV